MTMKRRKQNATVVTSVSLPREVYPKMVARAKEVRRNKSNYLLSLILADLNAERREVVA